MILRRLTTALRKQDWFTVVIETLIVVLGVFLGLQVNNWNAARGQRAAEAGYLAALESDAVFSIGSLRETLNLMDQAQEARRALYEYNREGGDAGLPPDDVNKFMQGAMFNIQRMNVREVAFDALTNSGQLSLIRDAELASQLQALDAAIELARRWESESINFTYEFSDPYLIAEADTENLIISNLVGTGENVPWIRGNDAPALTAEQLKSVRFKNLLLYQADISRGRARATADLMEQYQKVLDLVRARQSEIGSRP